MTTKPLTADFIVTRINLQYFFFLTKPHLNISCEHIPLVVVGGTEGQEVLTALAQEKLKVILQLFFFFIPF